MQNFKRLLAAVCALVTLVLCCAGCSTPANAMTIDGYEVSTGEYLANLYNMFYQAYYNSGLYYTAYYNNYTAEQIWDMDQTYGEGDTALTMKLDDYVKQMAKDSLIRQQVVKDLLKENELTLTDEDKKSLAEQMEQYNEAEFLQFGFNRENYEKMITGYNFEESALFYGLYDKGGKKEVKEDEVRKYFDTNYLVYKTFTLSLVDSEGAALKDAEATKIKDQMKGYLDMYNNGTDVLEVYKKYLADEEAKQEADKNDTTTTDKEEEEEIKLNFTSMVATGESANKDLAKALQGLKNGEATTVEYTASGSNKVIAFVVRYDYDTDTYKSKDEYYKDSRKSVLYNIKGDEFEESLKEPIKKMGEKVEVNERTIKMCDPINLLAE